MKWLVLALILVVVFALFRRMNRDTNLAFWQQRPEMPFDDFYAQFYATSGLEPEAVRMALNTVASATHVPATRIVPTDRVDDLKPGALQTTLSLLHRVLDSALAKSAGIPQPVSWNADTVDDVIRLLGPYYSHIRVSAD